MPRLRIRALRLALAMPCCLLAAGVAHAADPCAAIVARAPAGMRITAAVHVDAAGHPAPPATTGACRVDAVIDTETGTQIWLPDAPAWNGRILGVGVGGQAGSIPTPELMRGAARGYAAMANDSGHKASDTHWLLGPPERAANYAGRANHRMAELGQALVAAWYGRPARQRFFIGCSGGGRQALAEVQRYPQDFDGVIAGAPGVDTPEMSARRMWEMGEHSRNGALMDAATWRRVAQAAVAACDGLDGLRDGILGDPFRCRFDAGQMQCPPAGPTPGCLDAAQVAAVRRLYAPLVDEAGHRLDDGLLPGTPVSPAPLPEPFTPGPTYLAVALFGDGVHRDAHWDPHSFRLVDDLPAIDRVMDLHADIPDIDTFRAGGGKLILYQGLADPLVSAQSTIGYAAALRHRYGAGLGNFVRLFLIPGMEHCRGGDTTDRFGGVGGDGTARDPAHDMLSALEAWADGGPAPTRLIATETAPTPRSRPLCAWPATARYRGGDVNDAASFTCGGPVATESLK